MINNTIKRILAFPKQSFFLFGPRGTGKSTWVKTLWPDAILLDFLSEDICFSYTANPEQLREMGRSTAKGATIIIDEVQKVPRVLSLVHLLMEERRDITFALTGSSPRTLKRSSADLLAGRAILSTMHPFIAAELGDDFSLEAALRHGLLPVILAAPEPLQALRSYVAMYMREEVKQEGLVRSYEGFARFLHAVSFSHAGIMNISSISRECFIERKTVEGYLSILEDLLLGWRLPIFTRRAQRAPAAHPKFYLFDTGVFRFLRPSGPLDSPNEIEGAALEGLVAQHLRAWIDYRQSDLSLYYWRTRGGSEVDFVLYGHGCFWAIEVKNSQRIRTEDLRGLRTFGQDYQESRLLFLYRGTQRMLKEERILCMPVEDFLRGLHPGSELL